MNILFLTYDFPYPTTSGGKSRAYHLLKHTAKKANIFLFSFVRDDYNPEWNNEILALGIKDIKVFRRRKLNNLENFINVTFGSSIFKSLYFDSKVLDLLKEIIHKEKIDIVHYESSYTGYYIQDLKGYKIKQVLGTENIEFMLYDQLAKHMDIFSPRPVVSLMAKRLMREEISMIKSADAVTVVTDEERSLLEKKANVKSYKISNGIETENYGYSFDPKLKNNMLFVGNFTYFPNVDAVNFFYKEVFSDMKDDITFTILGKKSSEKFKFSDKRIVLKEFVEDIIEEYRNADFLIFPIRIGGGTNFKVLEAMSLGVPIIAQPERLAGLKAYDGKHFLKAESPQEYKEKIKLLYNDVQLRKYLTVEARKLVEENFEWRRIGEDLLSVWRKTL